MSRRIFTGHKISEGTAAGEVLISEDAIMFYLVDPQTGVVIEKGHALEGRSLAGKVLVCPGGKGSSVVQADGLYQLSVKNNAPAAMIIRHPDTVLVTSAIIMEMPMIDRVEEDFYRTVKDGDAVRVNADNGEVEIISE
jgi:uncharacterized protein